MNKFKRFRSINNIRSSNKSVNTDLVIVEGCLASGMKIKVLIDNGSQANLVSKDTALKLGKSISPSSIRLAAAQGTDMEVIGETDLELSIGNHEKIVKAQVVDNLSEKYQVILGLAWLNNNNTSFVTSVGRTPIFKINDVEIPIIRNMKDGFTTIDVSNISDNTVDFVKCPSDIKIEPRSVGFIKLKIPYNEKLLGNNMIYFEQLTHSSDIIDEYGDNENLTPLFKLLPTVIKVKLSGNNRLYCRIPYKNLSSNPIYLKRGNIVGNLSLVDEIDDVKLENLSVETSEGCEINNVIQSDSDIKERDYTIPHVRQEYIKGLVKNKCADPKAQELVEGLFKKYPSLVKCPGEVLNFTNALEHEILYDGPKTIFVPPYKTSPVEMDEINKEVLSMLDNDLVEVSRSGFNLPLLVVRKRDNTIRLCTDSRALKRHICSLRIPLPSINELLRTLGPCKVYTTLDLKSAFHQVLLKKESRKYTAFRTSLGIFHMKRMAFGLPNSPSTMSQLIAMVVTNLPGCVAYLDDILVGGKDLEDCAANVERVLQRLSELNLTLAPEKCTFFQNQVKYLGHILTSNGIKQDPSKIKAIKEAAIPKTLKDLRSFMGMASYYRKFTKNFADLVAPLTDLTKGFTVKKGSKILLADKWKQKHTDAFERLKSVISEEIVLSFPDFSKPFKLSVDASDFALGGVLSQFDVDAGLDRPVTFFSRRLSDAERNYTALDKECFAIIYGLKYNRELIFGRDVELISDSEPLVHLLKQSKATGRVARWQTILSDFRITNIRHIAGVKNIIPDYLSRMAAKNIESECVDDLPLYEHRNISSKDCNISPDTNTTGCKQTNLCNHGNDQAHQSQESAQESVQQTNAILSNHGNDQSQESSQAVNVPLSNAEIPAYPATVLHKKGGALNPSLEDIKLARQYLQPTGSETLNDVSTEDIIQAQKSYMPFNEVRQYLLGKKCRVPRQLGIDVGRFMLINDILCINSVNAYNKIYNRIAVPPSLVYSFLRISHLITGHGGVTKITEDLKRYAWWRCMSQDAIRFARNCQICRLNKSYNMPKVPILQHPEVKGVWDKLHLDLLGPLPKSDRGNVYILTCVDAFSRFAIALPLLDKRMETIARAMVTHVFSVFGCPSHIYTDLGREFFGAAFKQTVKKLGINQRFSTSWSPASNGSVEKFNKTISEILRCLTYKQPASWDLSLSLASMAYNHSYNQAVSESPYYIMFLRDPMLPYSDLLAPTTANASDGSTTEVRDYVSEFVKRAKVVFNICKNFSESQMIKRNNRINADRKFRDIKVGDRIYLKVNIRRNKFIQRFDGPYRVAAVRGKIIYCYSLNNKKFKCVQSEKCRYAGDLFQDDDPTVNLAFPENPPIDEKDLLEDSEMGNLSSIHDAKHGEVVAQPQPSGVQSSSEATAAHKSNFICQGVKDLPSSNQRIYSQNKPLNLSRGQVVNHRYSLRSRA